MENIKKSFEHYILLSKEYEASLINFAKLLLGTAICTALTAVLIHWLVLFLGFLLGLLIVIYSVKAISKKDSKAIDALDIVKSDISEYLSKILGVPSNEFELSLIEKEEFKNSFELHLLSLVPTNYSNMIGILQRERKNFQEIFGENFDFLIRVSSI